MKRVIVFIDGFNLHHTVDNLKKDHLKWLDLRKLSQAFAPSSHFEIGSGFLSGLRRKTSSFRARLAGDKI